MPQTITCSVSGCARDKIVARGLCSPHYKRWHRYGDPEAGQALRKPRSSATCVAEDCGRAAERRDWCGKHYMRLLRHGDPAAGRDRVPSPDSCAISGCAGRLKAQGLCVRHYARSLRGDLGDTHKPCRQCGDLIALYPDGMNGRKVRANVSSCERCQRPPNPITAGELSERDGGRCGVCRAPVDMALGHPHPLSPSVDHVIPWSRGGANEPDNCQLAHLVCNLRKNNRTDYAPTA